MPSRSHDDDAAGPLPVQPLGMRPADFLVNLTLVLRAVQVLRFANLVFEPLWSRNYIRNVQVPRQQSPSGRQCCTNACACLAEPSAPSLSGIACMLADHQQDPVLYGHG